LESLASGPRRTPPRRGAEGPATPEGPQALNKPLETGCRPSPAPPVPAPPARAHPKGSGPAVSAGASELGLEFGPVPFGFAAGEVDAPEAMSLVAAMALGPETVGRRGAPTPRHLQPGSEEFREDHSLGPFGPGTLGASCFRPCPENTVHGSDVGPVVVAPPGLNADAEACKDGTVPGPAVCPVAFGDRELGRADEIHACSRGPSLFLPPLGGAEVVCLMGGRLPPAGYSRREAQPPGGGSAPSRPGRAGLAPPPAPRPPAGEHPSRQGRQRNRRPATGGNGANVETIRDHAALKGPVPQGTAPARLEALQPARPLDLSPPAGGKLAARGPGHVCDCRSWRSGWPFVPPHP